MDTWRKIGRVKSDGHEVSHLNSLGGGNLGHFIVESSSLSSLGIQRMHLALLGSASEVSGTMKMHHSSLGSTSRMPASSLGSVSAVTPGSISSAVCASLRSRFLPALASLGSASAVAPGSRPVQGISSGVRARSQPLELPGARGRLGLIFACSSTNGLQPSAEMNNQGTGVYRVLFPSEIAREKMAFTSESENLHQDKLDWVEPVALALRSDHHAEDDEHPTVESEGHTVTVYYRDVFSKLRHCQGVDDEDFAKHLMTTRLHSGRRGGLSQARFSTTVDGRFFVKQDDGDRFSRSFLKFGPTYFQHVSQNENCLAKVLGLYKVSAKEGSVSTVIVTEGLKPPQSMGNIIAEYDLKGTLQRDAKMADLDFAGPILLEEGSHKRLFESLERDTQLLEDSSLVDYSLYVAQLDTGHLVVGVIDYLGMVRNRAVSTLLRIHRGRLLKALHGYFPAAKLRSLN